jgi:oxygen-independent coproporphyrinogen-3 oxidase
MNIIEQCKNRINALPQKLLATMERARPVVVYEKAHVYPISVPEKWLDVDETIIDWRIPPDKPLRLYLHVPWCRSKCIFCFYESKAGEPCDDDVKHYLECLKRELSIYCKRLGVQKMTAETLYIGGGTPSILNPVQIESLLQIVHSFVDFKDNAFLITECSPGTLSPDKVQAFVEGGINRISIGVQSFQDHILKICRRDHDADQAIRAYDMVRAAAVPEINFDLMLALPDQSLSDFEQTVQKALELAPSSLSFLDLRVAPGSKLHEMGYYYPTWREDILMRAIYQQMIKGDGRYERTRPHYYVRRNEARARSTRVPCLDSRSGYGFQIGVGVTAYSHLGDSAFINGRAPFYSETLKQGRLPVVRGLILTEEDKTAMKAIRAIVDYTLVPDAPAVLAQYEREVQFLGEHGLIDEEYRLTDDGCLFGEEVAYMFYPHLTGETPQTKESVSVYLTQHGEA